MTTTPVKFRTVGFTRSLYPDGRLKVGWKGEFFSLAKDAESAGCGDNGMANGYEVRAYTDEDRHVWDDSDPLVWDDGDTD